VTFPASINPDFRKIRVQLGLCDYAKMSSNSSANTNRVPATQPLFFPTGSSSATPAQIPDAKPVKPRNCRVPSRDPLTRTRSSTL